MPSKSEDPEMAKIKAVLDIEDKEIAKWFGYKNRNAYQQSSGKTRIENGIKEIWKRLSEKVFTK